MTIAVNILIAIIIIILLFFLAAYYPTILQTEVFVKYIVKEKPIKNGDILFAGDKFEVKGLWTVRQLNLQDLNLIKGYVEITPGLEDVYCIDFVFSRPPKILFDISRQDHRELIDIICEKLKVPGPNWENPFIFTNDIGKNFQTIYKK